MYAILRAGGKQVKVAPGDVVRIERTAGEKSQGRDASRSRRDVVLVSGDGGVRHGNRRAQRA